MVLAICYVGGGTAIATSFGDWYGSSADSTLTSEFIISRTFMTICAVSQ